jgi:hypothetical protein
MATIVKTNSGSWKAIIRIAGNPLVTKTFRIKRDATDWSRTTEDEIIRVVYITKSHSEKTTIAKALDRYLKEITPTKKPSSQKPEIRREKIVRKHLGKYSLASLSAANVAQYRDICILILHIYHLPSLLLRGSIKSLLMSTFNFTT